MAEKSPEQIAWEKQKAQRERKDKEITRRLLEAQRFRGAVAMKREAEEEERRRRAGS